ncbi:MAG TPA: aminofutalosine synthase MqnE [Planctomycetota bacterium]|nr:aminofutalosine synthase MqnE [Planctomycetota bacterium]
MNARQLARPFQRGPTNPGPQGGFSPSTALLDDLGPELAALRDKLAAGGRLSLQDGRLLFATPDLNGVGALANWVNERLNGNRTTFTYNRHLNYTNVCAYRCMFCAFRRDGDESDAVVMDLDFVRDKLRREFTDTMREVHIVGGINPALPYEYYLDLLRTIRAERPNLHIKAFTMIELDAMAQLAGKNLEAVVADLREAGLGSCPGGGAEVLSPRVHRKLYREKLPPERWIAACKTVHHAGLHTNATMLFGHIETTDERLDHLLAIREIQDETGGFLQFIPLVFHPEHTPLQRLGKTSGLDALRTIAVARLMLDNLPHVKAYWIMLGLRIAQIALHYGADDIDGTVEEEHITHDAGGTTPQGLTTSQLVALIREAGREPVLRDTLYRDLAPVAEERSPV